MPVDPFYGVLPTVVGGVSPFNKALPFNAVGRPFNGLVGPSFNPPGAIVTGDNAGSSVTVTGVSLGGVTGLVSGAVSVGAVSVSGATMTGV